MLSIIFSKSAYQPMAENFEKKSRQLAGCLHTTGWNFIS
jgi:hypothetical protein